MPKVVQSALDEARLRRGPARIWLNSRTPGWGQVGDCFVLLRSKHPPQLVGWLVGIGMFGDALHTLPDVILRERHHAPIPHIIEAFVAGVLAEVPTTQRQWKSIESLLDETKILPESLAKIVPLGLISKGSIDRGVAMRLAARLGAPCAKAIQKHLDDLSPNQRKAAQRLREALGKLSSPPVRKDDASDETLLQTMLSAWQTHRDPKLADRIIGLGKHLGSRRAPLHAKSKGELEGIWHALASSGNSADVDRLMGTPWPGAWKAALARVDLLANFPKDPRIARGLVDLIPRYSSNGSSPLHKRISALLSQISDPQTAEAVERTIESRWANKDDYRAALAHIRAVEVTEAPQALLDSIPHFVPQDLPSLWEKVWDSPGDHEARLVLADRLQQTGDSRGEFIALQHAIAQGRSDRTTKLREKQLLDAHIDEWTGPLPSVLRASRRFRCGFLAEVQTNASSRELKGSLELKQWRTIEALVLDGSIYDAKVIAALLKKMPVLRSLTITRGEVDGLSTKGPFNGIEIVHSASWFPPSDRTPFPDLRVLGLRDWTTLDLARLLSAARAAKLEALCLPQYPSDELLGVFETIIQSKERPALTVDVPLGCSIHTGWHLRLPLDSSSAQLHWISGQEWTRPSSALTSVLARLLDSGYRSLHLRLPGGKRTRERLHELQASLSQQHPKLQITSSTGATASL